MTNRTLPTTTQRFVRNEDIPAGPVAALEGLAEGTGGKLAIKTPTQTTKASPTRLAARFVS